MSDSELRKKAEIVAAHRMAASNQRLMDLSKEETQQLFYELHVHQIELEMQNEELRRIQSELDTARARYFDLYDLAPAGYVTVSGKGLIIESNLTFANQVNIPRQSLIGIRFSQLVQKEDQDTYYLHRRQIFETRQPSSCELRIIKKDAAPFWAHLEAALVSDVDGEDACRVVLVDITEHKQFEEKIRSLNAGLELRVQKRTAELQIYNKELESFSYSVSHDLRTPLRSIEGFCRIFMDEFGGMIPEKGLEYLERVRRNSLHMGQLIDSMLELSRLSRSEMQIEKLDVSALAAEVAKELDAENPNREVHVAIEAGIIAEGDSSLLRIVLVNLLSNAWKFVSKRTHAHISVGTVMDSEHGLCVFVRDDGVGFDYAYKDKLFSAFQRLHSEKEYPGTGIGLATVARIIHRHGGEVWAEGEVEKGAVFYFSLPGLQAAVPKNHKKQSTQES